MEASVAKKVKAVNKLLIINRPIEAEQQYLQPLPVPIALKQQSPLQQYHLLP